MRRRDLITGGIAALAASGSFQNRAVAQVGGAGTFASIAERVLGTPTRVDGERKVLGVLVIVQTEAPRDTVPYDVSLFVQTQTRGEWNDIKPTQTDMGRAYTSRSFGSVVDYAVVHAERAAVSLFLPYEVLPVSQQVGWLGKLRFLLRFFPYDRFQREYIHDGAFDKAFFTEEYTVVERGVISRRFSGFDQQFFLWSLDEDQPWRQP